MKFRVQKKCSLLLFTHRHGVEEEPHQRDQEGDDHELDNTHLVVVPQHRLQTLQRVHHREERGIRPAAAKTNTVQYLLFVLIPYIIVLYPTLHRAYSVIVYTLT